MKLKLTLKKEWFDLMIIGKKKVEVRKPSKWIKSRLIDKNGNPKNYESVHFTNGYGRTRPTFETEFLGFDIATENQEIIFENGSVLEIEKGDYLINLGEVTDLFLLYN